MREERELAELAIKQVAELETTLSRLELRHPVRNATLAEAGRYLLDHLRILVGTPDYWDRQP